MSTDARALPVRRQLERLFELCRKGDAAAASELILVDDPQDPMRHLRKSSDLTNPHDKRHVDALVRRIAGWLDCERIAWGDFLTSAESEGEWLAWEVKFYTGPDGPRRYFGFLEVDGVYRLGDIDQ